MTFKAELRVAARARRTQLAAALPAYAVEIARFAADLMPPSQAVVSSYWPLHDEADPRVLAQALSARGQAIVLPCVAGTGRPLLFRCWREGEPLQANLFGVREPAVTAPQASPAIILVPLLAFDAEGFRLGYGGGYYDRTLADLRARGAVLAIGIAYGGQETEGLPRDSHDQPLDMVVTEHGVRHFAREQT